MKRVFGASILREYPTIRLVLAVLVLASALALVSSFVPPKQYQLHPEQNDGKSAKVLFKQEISRLGGKAAYARMSVAVARMSIEEQHEYAHSFGDALYAVEGEKGIGACDGQFGLGCFHQFLGDAIADLGPSAVQRLYDECGTITGTRDLCKHGLGHGVLAGFGYTLPDLLQALSLCNSVTKEETYSGCSGGVFMEYNLRMIARAEGLPSVRYDTEDLFAPCDSVPAADGKTCMFWLPQWWYFAVFHGDRTHGAANPTVIRVGELCAASPYPQPCFEGIGYIVPISFRFDTHEITDACDSLDDTAHGRTYCRGMAALVMHLTYHDPAIDDAMCRGLSDEAAQTCRVYQRHENDFSFTVPELP